MKQKHLGIFAILLFVGWQYLADAGWPTTYAPVDSSGNMTLPGSGTFIGGIVGETTGTSAPPGTIGEVISSSIPVGSAVAMTSGTPINVTSITLGPGDWDIYGMIDLHPGSGTSIANTTLGISQTSNMMGQQDTYSTNLYNTTSSIDLSANTPTVRFSTSVQTVIYLVVSGTFSTSTLSAYGTIWARRAR